MTKSDEMNPQNQHICNMRVAPWWSVNKVQL